MSRNQLPATATDPDTQHARFLLRFGKRAGIGASVEVTSSGIRSVALLVTGILLSTAVIVGAAKKGRGGQGARPD